MKNLSVEDAFKVCASNIASLPSDFKKWKTSLDLYRFNWSFISDHQTRDGIAEQEMGLDFLWSLDCWLDPKLVFEFSQKLLFMQGLGAIYEAVLRDLWKNSINNSNLNQKIKSVQISKLEKDNFDNLIKASKNAELLNELWTQYIDEVRKIRNLGHIIKSESKKKKLRDGEIFRKNMEELKKDLKNFREFIRLKYSGEPEIPF